VTGPDGIAVDHGHRKSGDPKSGRPGPVPLMNRSGRMSSGCRMGSGRTGVIGLAREGGCPKGVLFSKQPGYPGMVAPPGPAGAVNIRTQRRSIPEEVRRCTRSTEHTGRGAVAWDKRSCRTRAARGQRSNNRRPRAQAGRGSPLGGGYRAAPTVARVHPSFLETGDPPTTSSRNASLGPLPSSPDPSARPLPRAGFSLPRAGIRVVGARFHPDQGVLRQSVGHNQRT
jgi:hypothetical protein